MAFRITPSPLPASPPPPSLDLTSRSPIISLLCFHPTFFPLQPLFCQAHLVLPSAILFSSPSPSSLSRTWGKPNKARYLGERLSLRPPRQVPYGLMSAGGVVPGSAPASQFIAARCWGVICCFIPSVCTMGALWGSEQRPLEFRSNALTSAHPTHRALVSQRRTPSLHPPVLCPPGPSPHPPHSPTRRMATAGGVG